MQTDPLPSCPSTCPPQVLPTSTPAAAQLSCLPHGSSPSQPSAKLTSAALDVFCALRPCPPGLDAQLQTPRLQLRPVDGGEESLRRARRVFGDAHAMRYYGRGVAKNERSLQKRVAKWDSQWRAGSPYSGLAVTRRDSGGFVGFVRLAPSAGPGVAELSFAFAPEAWGRGYATEAVQAVVNVYAPALRRAGHLVCGAPLRGLVATVHPEHVASQTVLHRAGLAACGRQDKVQGPRLLYNMAVPGVDDARRCQASLSTPASCPTAER